MIRPFILLLTLVLSSHAYGQYNYNEQRQKEADRYLESIKKGQEFSNTKSSEFKMNENAVQEMVDRWKGNRQTAKKTHEDLERDYARKQAEESSHLIRSLMRNLEIREKADEISTPVAMLYLDAGFEEFEAKALSLRSLRAVPRSDEVVYQLDTAMLLAANAHILFQEKKDTGSFDELFGLVMKFRTAGYSALRALEKLEKRFPEQQDLIAYAKPFAALAYWTNGELMPWSYHSSSANARMYDYYYKNQMDSSLRSWFRKDSIAVKAAITQTKISTSWEDYGTFQSSTDKLLAIARSTDEDKKVETAAAGKIKVKKVKYEGNEYEGEVNEKNIPHGKGKLITHISRIGKEVWISYREGNFVNGLRHGKIFEQSNCDTNGCHTFDGYYVLDKREGWGKDVNPDIGTYEGEWKQNHRHGKGKMTYLNGYVEEGFWFYDVFTMRKSQEN